jgi:hypothetical protein
MDVICSIKKSMNIFRCHAELCCVVDEDDDDCTRSFEVFVYKIR